jgi:hypothetical protein
MNVSILRYQNKQPEKGLVPVFWPDIIFGPIGELLFTSGPRLEKNTKNSQ